MTNTEFKAAIASLVDRIASKPAVAAKPAKPAVAAKPAQTAKPARPASPIVTAVNNTTGYAFGELYLNSPAYPIGVAIPAITAKPASAAIAEVVAVAAISAVPAVPVQLPLPQFEPFFSIQGLNVRFCLPIENNKFGLESLLVNDLKGFRSTDKTSEVVVFNAIPDLLVSAISSSYRVIGGQAVICYDMTLVP